MMTRYGMLVDTRKCIGCYACREACQHQNKLLDTEPFIRYEERVTGKFPTTDVEMVPMQCMQCSNAPCASVCPTGASHIGPDGIVVIDHGRCIGCLYCMAACPYQLRVRNEETGAVDKCRFCVAAVKPGEAASNCVSACPMGVRTFGDLEDPQSEISRKIRETGAKPLVEGLTEAAIYYAR